MPARCGRFKYQSNTTTASIIIPPKKMVKNRICRWCAVELRFRLTRQIMASAGGLQIYIHASHHVKSGATTNAGR